jgi:uncharacterized membrane protein YczE
MILSRISVSIALGLVLLGTSAGLKYAQHVDLIEPDTAKRLVQVMIGLMLAGYANVMPKNLGTWPASPVAVARAQSALRVGGWSLTLAGFVYAGLWALAPLEFANLASMAIVATALFITMGYGARTLLACRATRIG